eukprot:TRINITY_DN54947_c0_g1_i1.p2 TRINITY_DN54947_c0_g1~~TRINITY_DN54947_c0_g1_i1.p2  ORF type:complete len:115 (-),score=14.94 TRINITY_DN54947_c0_g1_i1:8-352(-)
MSGEDEHFQNGMQEQFSQEVLGLEYFIKLLRGSLTKIRGRDDLFFLGSYVSLPIVFSLIIVGLITVFFTSHVLCVDTLSLIHISEPTRPLYISYAVFCLKKKNNNQQQFNLSQS